ncbi:MAG: CPBP family intramembrane metalloprotease [Clostridiales bacterium]|jgi:membrane protease YdiL (CAAX protease family)|nr:CPBP family intramembrane metalloprotease [Clostridiales bacterium]
MDEQWTIGGQWAPDEENISSFEAVPAEPAAIKAHEEMPPQKPFIWPPRSWLGAAITIFLITFLGVPVLLALPFLLSSLPDIMTGGPEDLSWLNMGYMGWLMIANSITNFLGFGIVPFLIVRRSWPRPWSVLGLRKDRFWRILGLGVLSGVIIFILQAVLSGIISWFAPDGAQSQEILNTLALTQNAWMRLGLIISIAVLAPFCEEVFFRGFLYPALTSYCNFRWALLISSAVFALAHGNFTYFPVFLGGGFALAWLYHKYQNLWLSILAHATWNTISLLLFFGFQNLAEF